MDAPAPRFSHRNEDGTIPQCNSEGLMAMARRKRDARMKDLFDFAADNNTPSIVYVATNQSNGHRYVGQTRKTLAKRIWGHVGATNQGSRLKFHNAIRKHGIDAFIFDAVSYCDTAQEAKRREQELIALIRPEYNLTKGGDGMLGWRASPEARRKMSLAKLGKPGGRKGIAHSPEVIAKISATKRARPTRYWLGKRRDQATIDKIVAAKAGKPPSTKAKAANTGRQRPVLCLTDGLAFANPKAAAAHYGCSHGLIVRVCRHGNERPWKIKKSFVYVEDWLR